MNSRRPLHLLVALCLLVGLIAVQPATPVLATGVIVSNDSNGDDFWPALAESPTGNRLVALWNQGLSVRSSTSTNGGATWSAEIELAKFSSPDVNEERIVYDKNGNLHAFFMAGQGSDRVVRYRYVAAGADPAQLSNWGTGTSVCSNCVRPDAHYDNNGRIILTYEQSGSTFVRRTSGLGSWEPTIRSISEAGQANVTVTPDNKIHIIYLGDDKNIYYARYSSFDTWQQETAEIVNTEFSNMRPDIASSPDGHVHLVWFQIVGDSRPPFYSEYIPGVGRTGPIQVGAAPEPDTPQYINVATDSSNNVYVNWTAKTPDPNGDIYQNMRINGVWGDNFDFTNRLLTPQGGPARTGKYTLSHTGSVGLIFAEFVGGFYRTSYLVIASDSEPPVVTGIGFSPPPAGSQRATGTVSGNDPATQGAASGLARIDYSFDGTNWVMATAGGVNPISGNPTSISNLAFDVDLANPGAGGSWASGGRVFHVRLIDARGNISATATTGINVTLPPVAMTRYLAEGYTGGTFDEYVTLANPSSVLIYVSITALYAGTSSGVPGTLVPILPNQRQTVLLDNVVGSGKELSLKLESNAEFFAERPMYFTNYPAAAGMAYNKSRASALANINGGHLGVAATAPAEAWYFAEGYTGTGFEGYFTIQNPNPSGSTVQIDYFLTDGTILVRNVVVNANQRLTVIIHGADNQGGIGANRAYSARVRTTNGVNIIVERVQYFNYTGDFGLGISQSVTGGMATLGATAPGTTWYFAEGTTRPGFDQYLTLQNPNAATNRVRITYFVAGQGATSREIVLPSNSRTTVAVHNAADPTGGGLGRGTGAGLDHSTKVESLDGRNLVAERPMYFIYQGGSVANIDGGHNVMGSMSLLQTGQTVILAEGYTGDGFHEYLTLQNPNSIDALVRITYLLATGGAEVKPNLVLPANQRTTVAVHNAADPTGSGLGAGIAASVKIEVLNGGGAGIAVERVMYFRYNGIATGGNSAFGTLMI